MSNSKPPSGTTDLGQSLDHPQNPNGRAPSQWLKKTVADLVPARRVKTPTEVLHKSDLYRDASKANQDLASLLPHTLEHYLSGLLGNDDTKKLIEDHKLTADEVVAIKWYGQDGFQYVQQSLRQIPDPLLGAPVAPPKTFKNLIKAFQRGFAKLPPLPPGTELFRGTNFLFDENLKPGDVYTDPAFVSTSTKQAVADHKFEGRYLLHFVNVPADDPRWRDISLFTSNSTEAEVLFLPNTSFRVVSREPGDKEVVVGEGEGKLVKQEIVTLEPITIN